MNLTVKTDVAKTDAEKQNNNNEKMQQNTNYKYQQHYNPPAQNLSQDSGLSPRYDVLFWRKKIMFFIMFNPGAPE